MTWKGRDVISNLDFSRADYERLFEVADEMARYQKNQRKLLEGTVLGSLFFMPSTRTRMSFATAMYRLGGTVIDLEPNISSIAKGENLHDTIKMADAYSNVILIRSDYGGSDHYAAQIAAAPVVSAACGNDNHPTQGFLDLYTIRKEFGRVDNLHVAIVGFLRFNRPFTSLAYALSKFRVKLSLVSPPGVGMRREVLDRIRSGPSIDIREASNIDDVIEDVDVLYTNRVHKEQFIGTAEGKAAGLEFPKDRPLPEQLERLVDMVKIRGETIRKAKSSMIIMHPLPRVGGELPPEIDRSPHARYFEQAANGVPIRMALLVLVLGAMEDGSHPSVQERQQTSSVAWKDITCPNPLCITNQPAERPFLVPRMVEKFPDLFECGYCGWYAKKL